MSHTIATINLAALKHNFSQIETLAPNCYIWAMIKGNGYGHGLVRVAKTLSGADTFGVTCIEEGLALRQEAGIKSSIVIMKGFYNEAELLQFYKYNLGAVVHCLDQVCLLEKKNQLFLYLYG